MLYALKIDEGQDRKCPCLYQSHVPVKEMEIHTYTCVRMISSIQKHEVGHWA